MGMWDKVKKALVGEAPPEKPSGSPAASKPKDQNAADTAGTWAGAGTQASEKGQATSAPSDGKYKRVKVSASGKGWGGPLVIEPKPGKDLIYSVTGGGIHPIAQKIADLTGGRAFDGFNSSAGFDEIACAVIDCGGTARVGVYPMKKVPTIDIYPTSPSGPLAKFITEDVFVSGVKIETIELEE